MINEGTKEYIDEYYIPEDEETLNELINEFWGSEFEYEVPDISFELTGKIKKIILIVLCVVLGTVVLTKGANYVSYKINEQLFQEAVNDFENGDYAKAVQQFSKFDKDSKFYSKADVYIRKYETAEGLFNTALDLYKQKDFDEALKTISTLNIVISGYPQGEKLKSEIIAAKEQQVYRSEELAMEGIKLIDAGDVEGAYNKFEMSVGLCFEDGENLKQLKKKLALYAAAKIHNAEVLFQNGKVNEAAQIADDTEKRMPTFSRISNLNKQISLYYSAVEKVKTAQNLFQENKFTEANEAFEEAVSISPVILKTHSEILQKIKGNVLSKEFMTDEQKQFLDNIEISNVLYTEKSEGDGMILMFDIKNITDNPIEFYTYWCQIEINGETYYPEPATLERYVSAMKLKEDGMLDNEFAEDDLVIKSGDTYRLMFNLADKREFYIGAVFYYVDRTHEVVSYDEGTVTGSLKIPLLIIE